MMMRLSIGLLAFMTLPALGDSTDQAIRMHNRLTGAPPSSAVLQQMTTLIEQGNPKDAALIATQDENFLKITIKNMVTPWTNEAGEINAPLNDYTATLMGVIRDDLSFKSIFDDISYVGAPDLNLPEYSNANNEHYEAFEAGGFSYSNPAQFIRSTQTALTGFEIGAGIMTSRGFAEAYYDAGTNRLPFAAVMATYTCREMEQLHDNTLPKGWIRQDVERAPGGDVKLYLAKCSGCHGLMDGMTRAFAHNDFVEGVNIYDSTTIPAKMTRNAYIFPEGRVVTGDDWVNLMTTGHNADMGWKAAPADGLYTGQGLVSFGQMIVETEAFDQCVPKKVYQQVCLREVDSEEEKSHVDQLSQSFVSGGYKMKALFAEAATLCSGE